VLRRDKNKGERWRSWIKEKAGIPDGDRKGVCHTVVEMRNLDSTLFTTSRKTGVRAFQAAGVAVPSSRQVRHQRPCIFREEAIMEQSRAFGRQKRVRSRPPKKFIKRSLMSIPEKILKKLHLRSMVRS
jgi:hypothetical protein